MYPNKPVPPIAAPYNPPRIQISPFIPIKKKSQQDLPPGVTFKKNKTPTVFHHHSSHPKPPTGSSKRPQAEAKPCKALASPLRAKFESGSSPSAQGPKSSKAAFNALTDLVGNSLASWTGVTAEGAEGCHFYFSSLDGFCWGAKRKGFDSKMRKWRKFLSGMWGEPFQIE